jgi:ketosteroid isomerase-like protein
MRRVAWVPHRGRMDIHTTTASTATSSLQTIHDVYAAFARGDVAAVIALIDDDVDWGRTVEAPGGDVVPHLHHGTGKAAAVRYFTAVAETMDFHVFSPHSFFTDGDEQVVVLLDLDMTVRPTGKRICFDEVHHFTVRNGRIVRYRPFLDTAQLVDAYTVG